MNDDPAPSLAPAPAGETRPLPLAFEGPAAFAAALQTFVEDAVTQRCREMVWLSPRFDDWPVFSADLLAALSAFVALPQRRVLLLAASFERLSLAQPRLAQWVRYRSHALQSFAVAEDDAAELPMLAWRGGFSAREPAALLRITAPQRWKGRWDADLKEPYAFRQSIDVLLQRASPAWPVTTLGI